MGRSEGDGENITQEQCRLLFISYIYCSTIIRKNNNVWSCSVKKGIKKYATNIDPSHGGPAQYALADLDRYLLFLIKSMRAKGPFSISYYWSISV